MKGTVAVAKKIAVLDTVGDAIPGLTHLHFHCVPCCKNLLLAFMFKQFHKTRQDSSRFIHVALKDGKNRVQKIFYTRLRGSV